KASYKQKRKKKFMSSLVSKLFEWKKPSRPIKIRGKNTVLYVRNQTSRFMPFINHPYVVELVCAVLARALKVYKGVVLCHYVFTPRGYEMIITGDSTKLSPFMGYIDKTFTDLFKKLLNIPEKSLWIDRFWEELVGSSYGVKLKIVSMYLKPLLLGLCQNIRSYGLLSSFIYIIRALKRKKCYSIHFPLYFEKLSTLNSEITKEEEKELLKTLHWWRGVAGVKLAIKPFYWKKCFKDIRKTPDLVIFKDILKIFLEELRRNKDKITGKRGRVPLRELFNTYNPKRRTRPPYIFCPEDERRAILYKFYYEFCCACSKAYQLWITEKILSYPRGAFIPTGPPFEIFEEGECFW
ncbi:MAG: hypothetical protein D6780_07945, partial [Candidatus Dadabacteria bacterium]